VIPLNNNRLYESSFAKLYPLYVAKANRKNRSEDEVIYLICWLTGYSETVLAHHLNNHTSVSDFFDLALLINQRSTRIHGRVCNVIIDAIVDPLMEKIRCLDKLIDDLAKGKSIEKITYNIHREEEI